MLIGAVVVAIIAVVVGYYGYGNYEAKLRTRDQKISQMENDLAKLQDQNAQLKINLNKAQSEEDNLAAQNNLLMKEIQQAQASGKVPALKLPYPPK
ncbi:MAG: hypothetical protein ACREQN_07920 [Candidatus Binataceae bacterium]